MDGKTFSFHINSILTFRTWVFNYFCFGNQFSLCWKLSWIEIMMRRNCIFSCLTERKFMYKKKRKIRKRRMQRKSIIIIFLIWQIFHLRNFPKLWEQKKWEKKSFNDFFLDVMNVICIQKYGKEYIYKKKREWQNDLEPWWVFGLWSLSFLS